MLKREQPRRACFLGLSESISLARVARFAIFETQL